MFVGFNLGTYVVMVVVQTHRNDQLWSECFLVARHHTNHFHALFHLILRNTL